MELSIQNGALLLLIAAVVAMLTRKLRLPYSVGLVAAGIGIAFLPYSPRIALTKELLFAALLPPLIFEAAFYIHWKQLRRELPVVLTLATVGVVLAAAVTAAGIHYFAKWEWLSAIVFGVLIAATDPVSVVATFREAKAHGRLPLLIESESLLNDGTAAVLFAVVLATATGLSFSLADAVLKLIVTTAGSLLCGGIVGGIALLLAGRTEDHLVEMTFTSVAAYGSFLLAEHFQFSGVLATLTAGLLLGNLGRRNEALRAFWEYAAFVANSFVFLLIGIHEVSRNFLGEWPAIGLAIVFVTLGRAFAVYPCCAMFARSPLKVTLRHQHVLFWGGLRGALALALALALPAEIPRRETIVTVSFAVVAFSVFVQSVTLTSLLRRFGEISPARVSAE